MAPFRLKELKAARPALPTFPAFTASQAAALDAGFDGTKANEVEISKPEDLGFSSNPFTTQQKSTTYTPESPLSPLRTFISSPSNFPRPDSPQIAPRLQPSPTEPDYLLEISDSIRQQLRQDMFPMYDIQLLDLLIDDLLGGDTPIEIIAGARLDKIIDEILQHVKQNFLNQDPAFQKVMRKAASLQAHWLQTFKERYHTMDAERLKIMKASGCLHNMEMSFDEANKIEGPLWQATKIETFSEMEANEHFEPGAWFLNVQCAIRDGIVRQDQEFTEGTSGKPVAFSLLSGMEIRGAVPGQWIHVVESTTRMYHSVRLTYVGCVIRLLRGHKLKSERAPRAGVRYDGFYKIESWGHVLLRLNGKGPDVYRNTLTLVELPGQKSMHALDETPCPWQSDNWEIYNRMIASEKKNKEGEAAFKEYRDAEAGEEFARRVFVEHMKSLGPLAYRALRDTTRRLDILPLQLPIRVPVMPAPPTEALRTPHPEAMPTPGLQ